MILEEIPVSGNPDAEGLGLVLLTPCTSPQEIRLVIVGHSHAYAVCQALMRETLAPDGVILARRFGIAGLRGLPNDSYWHAVRRLASQRTVAVIWNGNQHIYDFMFSASGYFDLVWSGREDAALVPGVPLVAEEMVRQHFRPSLDSLSNLLLDLQRASASRVLVLGTPAPHGTEDEVRVRLGREPIFPATAKSLGLDLETIPLTPLSVRIKLWAVLQGLMREIAQANLAVFVESPEDTYTLENGLKCEFWAPDVSHANGYYGAVVVSQLTSYVNEADRDGQVSV